MPRSTTTYAYTGAVQTAVVPAGATRAYVELWGAQGGPQLNQSYGRGGYIAGWITVTPGETLRFYVGGRGGDRSGNTGGAGGWNGGGAGGSDTGGFNKSGYGGGGASDIRRGGTALSNRAMVAAGGGGAGSGVGDGESGEGGAGGASVGQDGENALGSPNNGGTGATQNDGYLLGVGGAGAAGSFSASAGPLGAGGGGGGGYYGGGGGAQGDVNSNGVATAGGGGGGGSNYYNPIVATLRTSSRGSRVGHGQIRITYNSVPTVSVSGPVEGSTVTDARPTVTWSYSDAEGDSQTAFQVKVFSEAQYTAPGFNAETGIPTYDSGKVYSSATSHKVPIDLADGTNYRAYVRVWETDFPEQSGEGSYSNWDYNQFTVDNQSPVGNITAPTGTINNTSSPTATWTYTDAEGNPQTHYQLVVSEGDRTLDSNPPAQYEYLNTGKLAGSVTQRLLESLSNGTYTLWLRVWHAFGQNSEIQSAWDKQLFTINVPSPPAPSLTLTFEEVTSRIRIEANNTGGSPVTEFMEVEWLNPATNTFVKVRGAEAVAVDGSQAIDIYDYEFQANRLNTYRVRAWYHDPVSSEPYYSAWTQGTLVPQQDEWWLKDTEDPTKNIQIEPNGTTIDYAKPRDTTFFRALGRPTSIAVKDVQRAEQFRLTLDTMSDEEHDAMEAIIESSIQHTLLLQSPFESGKQWYVEIDSVSKRLLNVETPWHQFTTEFIEVSRP